MGNQKLQRAWLAALLLGPAVLLLLPAGFFDEGPALCLSRLLFGRECPGCGMTRAVMHLLHFDLGSAVFYNPWVVVVFPALVYVWWLWVREAAVLSGFLKKRA